MTTRLSAEERAKEMAESWYVNSQATKSLVIKTIIEQIRQAEQSIFERTKEKAAEFINEKSGCHGFLADDIRALRLEDL